MGNDSSIKELDDVNLSYLLWKFLFLNISLTAYSPWDGCLRH